MKRVLFVSIFLSVLSVLVIVIAPVVIVVSSGTVGPSPYMAEIEDIYKKTDQGLPPWAPEWSRLEELKLKNELWFQSKLPDYGSLGYIEILQKKSTKVAMFLILIWGIGTYYLVKEKFNYKQVAILIFPLLLWVFQIYSVITLLSVTGVVIAVFSFMRVKYNRLGKSDGNA